MEEPARVNPLSHLPSLRHPTSTFALHTYVHHTMYRSPCQRARPLQPRPAFDLARGLRGHLLPLLKGTRRSGRPFPPTPLFFCPLPHYHHDSS